MPRKLIPAYRLFNPTNAACVDLSGKRFHLGRYGGPEPGSATTGLSAK